MPATYGTLERVGRVRAGVPIPLRATVALVYACAGCGSARGTPRRTPQIRRYDMRYDESNPNREPAFSRTSRRRFGFQAPRRPRRDRARVLARYMTIEFVALPVRICEGYGDHE